MMSNQISWPQYKEHFDEGLSSILQARDLNELIETPEYLERTLGLLRGNVMHLEMALDQMMAMRPIIGMSNYRGPLKHLYITGASTHPGGGIMGASGRNAAQVVLRDLGRRR